MSTPFKTYVKTKPRHHRLLFFIDVNNISEVSLRSIMQANLHIWGGRYNPIVPVNNNTIAKEWVDLIEFFDPDFVYYSKTIDLKFIRDLNLFHPRQYFELIDEGRHYFPGVNIHCLLHDQVYNHLFANQPVLLQYDGRWDMEFAAKEFYKLNFGFQPLYQGESRWTDKLDTININLDNVKEINMYIGSKRTYFKSVLAAKHVDSVYLDGKFDWGHRRFQWILYEKDNYLNDLLYFWNRQLYFEPKNRLMQVISTVDELNEILQGHCVDDLLRELCIENNITLCSLTIDEIKIEELRKRAQELSKSVRFEKIKIAPFPFKPNVAQYIKQEFVRQTSSLILGKTDYLKFSELSFESNTKADNDPYAVDIILEKDTNDHHKEIKFPYDTELFFIVGTENSRVNKAHRISIFVSNNMRGTKISVPSNFELVHSVMMHRRKDVELISLDADYVEYSSAGQKLSAFYKLFDSDWSIIKQFLEEKFWLQLFRYTSEIPKSHISTGKGIFSHKDLKKEVDDLYIKYRETVRKYMEERPGIPIPDDQLDAFINRCKVDAFTYFIDDNLNYLIQKGGLFIGMKVKCERCGSNKWYSLTELRDKFPCKGCSNEIIPNLKSKIYYKLSDTIVNNLLSDTTGDGKEYDGNYVVLQTIIHLKEEALAGNSFVWSPSLDFSRRNGQSILKTDLDIVVIQNGKLIIGEAKCKVSEFTRKVIDSLVWAGDNLLPDKIIVACHSGNLDNIVNTIKSKLTNKNCQVISYKVYPPWYHLPGIFGVGIRNESETKPEVPKTTIQ
ncbi:MAG TPA: hypothetical protein VK492_00345 [Chitinophagaceae bacterium]|nr:hypothetical protein [Chitinophagaceae bacterium]